MNSPDLDAALQAARPKAPSASTVDASLMLSADLRATSRSTGIGRRALRRLGPVGALAVGIVGVGAVSAAAVYVGAHTGIFGNPLTSTEEADTSEYLNFQAADFPDAVRAIAPDYVVYPKGVDPADVTEIVIASRVDAGDAMEQGTGIVGSFEGYAYCSWAKTWLQEHDAGSAQGAATSALRMRESAKYPATVASDGGGVVDSLVAVADAADGGDRGAVQAEVDNNCGDWGKAGQP